MKPSLLRWIVPAGALLCLALAGVVWSDLAPFSAARGLLGLPPLGRTYWDNGVARSQGGTDGAWTAWYRDGNPREHGQLADGHRTGTWTQWHSNGQRASEGERRYDPQVGGAPRQGEWRFWHESGDLAAVGTFEDGRRTGEWRFWRADPAGGPPTFDERRSGTYRAGERVEASADPRDEGADRR